jgi:hypothetical protein
MILSFTMFRMKEMGIYRDFKFLLNIKLFCSFVKWYFWQIYQRVSPTLSAFT